MVGHGQKNGRGTAAAAAAFARGAQYAEYAADAEVARFANSAAVAGADFFAVYLGAGGTQFLGLGSQRFALAFGLCEGATPE